MTHYDLVIIGSGSGNSLVTPAFDGKKVAIVEDGIFGGTCLNVGCIPTKMFVYAAEVATTVRDSDRYGVDSTLDDVRWRDIRDRIFGRIDPISDAGKDYRVNGPNTTAYLGRGTFTGPREVSVDLPGGAETITGTQVVIATGSHAVAPDVILRSGVPFHTSDTIMRIDRLPRRMAIVGAGFIASEFAHVFSSLGVEVTIVARGDRMLRHLDDEIATAFTELAVKQWDVRLGRHVVQASGDATQVRLGLDDGTEVEADLLLVATGREPSTVGLGLEAAGVATTDDGRVRVDAYGRTTAEGVWALGDVSSDFQLKHVANHEARRVAYNLTHPDDLRPFDHRFVPSGVFSHPQIATVGLTEQQARDQGFAVTTKTQMYGDTAYGWAMEDTTSFVKLVADQRSGLLLGAHIMGPDATTVIQPAIQALTFGLRAADMARGQYWIHPAMAEVLENALLGLDLPQHPV